MSTDWVALLLAYLHDPPDKALSIRGHLARARDNATVAVGDRVSRREIEDTVSEADPLAAMIERPPMPTAGSAGERAIGPNQGQVRVTHPLAGTSISLRVPDLSDELTAKQQEQLRSLVAWLPGDGDQQARNRLLAIWRWWPDSLVKTCGPGFARLPADTRTPDHTIWNHLDITAAFKAAEGEGHGAALLAFAIGPVQQFIQAARSVRDLWSGSMILSWLAFRGMLPIIEQLGPSSLIYPALRGVPLVDMWLRDVERLGNRGDPFRIDNTDSRRTPCLPHRFLALVPWGADGATAKSLAESCRQAATAAWREIASQVKRRLQGKLDALCADWD